MQFLRFLLFSCMLLFSNLQGMAGMREYFGGSTTTPKFNPNPAVTKSDFSYGTTKPNIKTNQNPFHIKIPINSTYHPRNNQAAIKQNDLSYSTKTSDIKLKQEKIHTKVATDTTSTTHYASNNQAVMAALTAPRYTTETTPSLSSQLLANPSIKSYIEEEKAFRQRYCSFKSDAQIRHEKIEQEEKTRIEQIKALQEEAERIERTRILQEERTQVRVERKTQKILVDQFEELKKTATTKIRTEFVQPIQWGDYLPTTQSIFEYIGWREKAGVLKEKELLEIEHQARAISCAAIQAVFAAMVIKDDDHKKSLQFLISHSFGCDEFSDKNDNKLDKNVNAMFKKSSHGSGGSGNGGGSKGAKKDKDNNHDDNNNHITCYQIQDTIIDEKRCRNHIFFDEKTGCVTSSYAVQYDDPTQIYLTRDFQPFPVPHKEFSKIDQIVSTMREQSKVQTINRAILSDPAARIHNNTCDYHNGKITIQEAERREKLIYYEQLMRENEAKIKEQLKIEENKHKAAIKAAQKLKKSQNPGFVTRTVNYVFGKTPQQNKDTAPVHTTTTNQSAPTNQSNNASSQQTDSVNSKPQSTSVNPTPQVTGVTSPATSAPSTPDIPAVVSPDTSQTTPPATSTPSQPDVPAVIPPANNLGENKTKEPTNSPGDVTPPTNSASNIPAHIVQALASQATNNNKKPGEHKNPSLDPHGTKNKPAHGHEKPEESQAQKRRKQLIGAQESWLEKTDLGTASQEEKNMIQCMLDAMVDAKNDTDVEFAQAGLLAWEKAQKAESDEAYAYHIKKSKDYYKAVQRKTPLQSMADQAQQIKPTEIDKLLQHCTTTIDQYQEEKISGAQSFDNPFVDRVKKRAQALAESQEQLKSKNLPHRTYEISPQARGFMMAHNMNYTAFDGGKVTNYQHCLTQEILGIIESSAGAALKYDSKSMIGQLAQYNCDLAVSAQQLNQLAHVEQATALTDVSHFFQTYGRAMIDYELETEAWCGMVQGSYDGTVQALTKWNNFLIKLGHNRNQTLKELAHDCKSLGTSLLKIGAEIGEFTPFAYYEDVLKDMIDDFRNQSRLDDDASHQSRVDLRNERNLRSLQNALQTAEVVLGDMMKKSIRENVAGVTEIAIDGIITGKVTDALLHLSAVVGNEALQLAQQIKKNVPSHLQDATPRFATNAGELSIIAEGTGENIGSAMATQKNINNAEQIVKHAQQTNVIKKTVHEVLKPDQEKLKALEKMFEKYSRGDVLLPGLEEIKGVKQIEAYRAITNNFTTIEHIGFHDVMYLNMCNGLHPHALEINELVKKSMLKVVDLEGNIIHITKFDIFHTYIGEMRPNGTGSAKKGGHWFHLESKTATHTIEQIIPLKNGYFDIAIKHINDSGNTVLKTQFPLGSMPKENAQIIIDLIQEIKNPYFIETTSKGKTTAKFLRQCGQDFTIYIEEGIAHFHPATPNS